MPPLERSASQRLAREDVVALGVPGRPSSACASLTSHVTPWIACNGGDGETQDEADVRHEEVPGKTVELGRPRRHQQPRERRGRKLSFVPPRAVVQRGPRCCLCRELDPGEVRQPARIIL